jgi:deazaflavin-dependent oxidoreductase (nitroreductase family)
MRLEHEADTRGAPLAVWLIRQSKGRIGRLWRRRVLVLTTRGRRSGRRRAVPLQYFPDGETMVVVAANSGLPRLPGWYFNPTANERAAVEVEGHTFEVRTEELGDDEDRRLLVTDPRCCARLRQVPQTGEASNPFIRLVPAQAGAWAGVARNSAIMTR